jgi:hypothetical protein
VLNTDAYNQTLARGDNHHCQIFIMGDPKPLRDDSKFIGAYVPEEIYDAFAAMAKRNHRTIAAEMRRLIAEVLEGQHDD